MTRLRLDPKSAFQDFDRHNHFKVSPKLFQQVLAYFGFVLTQEELESVVKNYGNKDNQIEYLKFIEDAQKKGQPEFTQTRGPKMPYHGNY